MTKNQYQIANFLKKLGIQKKQKRLSDAASELQLLRQAEDILGRHVWKNIESIDKYKVNYWDLKKLLEKQQEIEKNIVEIQDQTTELKKNREQRFERTNNDGKNDLKEMHARQNERVKALQKEHAEILKIAGNIRRLYDGTVLKLQNLKEHDADLNEIQKEEDSLKKLKTKFAALKEKKVANDTKLDQQKQILEKIEETANSNKSNYKSEASKNYEILGKANKALATYRSQKGLLESKLVSHYAEIGNYIGKEYFHNKQCREAAKGHEPLCKIIKALRLSIGYNYDLSGKF